MGSIVKLECSRGDYEETINIGQGMRDYDPENFLDMFSQEARTRIRSVAGSGKLWSYSKRPAICNKCHRYTAVPVFEISGTKNDRLIGISDCGHDGCMVFENGEIEDTVKCPKCNSVMTVSNVGFWD